MIVLVLALAAQALPLMVRGLSSSAAASAAAKVAGAAPRLFPGRSFPAGAQAVSVAMGDLNGDGHFDAAVANAWGSVSVFTGNGDGTFNPSPVVDTNGGAGSVAIGDLDNDGRPDLAVEVNDPSNSYLSVYRGNGDGTFQAARTENLTPRSGRVVIAELNGDGNRDVVVSGNGGAQVLLGLGDGTFQPRTDYAGGRVESVAVGDLNGDGRADLAVPIFAESYSLGVMLGNGDGTFQDLLRYPSGNGSLFAAIGDLDGDGRPDLAVVNYNPGDISVLIGNGDGSFKQPIPYAVDGAQGSLAIGDLNGDARPDVVVTNPGSNTASVLLGLGDGRLKPAVNYPAGSVPTSVVIRDLDGDGRSDLAIAASGDGFLPLFGNGDGTLQAAMPYSAGAGTGSRSVVAGDLNNDGRPDLAVANEPSENVSVLLGRGDGAFEPPVNYFAGNSPRSVSLGDLNNDGRADIVVVGGERASVGDATGVFVLLGGGDGTFSAIPNLLSGHDLRSVAVAELNGDRNLDVIVIDATDGTAGVLLGNGDGTFKPTVSYPTDGTPQSVAVGDLNGDGRPELVVANVNYWGTVAVLVGVGDGTFNAAASYAAGGAQRAVSIGDLNGDGRPDLAVNRGVGVSVLLGRGDATFDSPVGYPGSYDAQSVKIGDLNGDHIPDLALADRGWGSGGAHVSLLLGNGDGTFKPLISYAAGSAPTSVAVADLNADGNRDLVVGNSGPPSATVSVLLSMLPRATGVPTLGLAVSGPPAVLVNDGRYTPDPFTVTGTVRNVGGAAAADVELALSPPAGLEFAAGSASHGVGLLLPNEQRQVTWSLRATGSSEDSTLSYLLTAAASNTSALPVRGQLTVPALFAINRFTPTKGGNAGNVTVTILGSGFRAGATATIGSAVGQNTVLSSSERLSARFDFTALAPSDYTVSVVNPDGTRATAATPMTVVNGGAGSLDVDLIVPSAIRGTTGNVLRRVPFLIAATNTGLVDLDGPSFDLVVADLNGDAPNIGQATDASNGVTVPFRSTTLAFFSSLPAGQSVVVNSLVSDASTQAARQTSASRSALSNPPGCVTLLIEICKSAYLNALAQWTAAENTRQALDAQLSYFAATCTATVGALAMSYLLGQYLTAANVAGQTLAAILFKLGLPLVLFGFSEYLREQASNCESSITDLIDAYKIWSVAWDNFANAWEQYSNCLEKNHYPPLAPLPAKIGFPVTVEEVETTILYTLFGAPLWVFGPPPFLFIPQPNAAPQPPINPKKERQACPVESMDPNDKLGPVGFSMERFIPGSSMLNYSVRFENLPSATAPAQQVVVTDRVDPATADASRLVLGPIVFGSTSIAPPPGAHQFANDVDLRPANNLILRVNATADQITGELEWRFVSLDPATMLPTSDPLAGFLPPNATPPQGEGLVAYSVPLRADVQSGAMVGSPATIVFDENASIDTPAWINTVDRRPPASSAHALPSATPTPSFPVSWSGVDAASGIATFDVYVSDNAGPFTLWQAGTDLTSAVFDGVNGHSYAFFSVARDNVGNTEPVKQSADTSTRVVIKTTPVIVTRASPPVAAGQAVSDLTTLLGEVAPTGTLTFDLFGPNKPTCSGPPAFSSSTSVDGGGTYSSANFTPTAPGTYQFVVSFSGDAHNNAVTTACDDPNGATAIVADSAAPVTIAALTPTANGSGWNNTNVTLKLEASDNSGGSGVANVAYSAKGAQTILSTVVNGSSVSVPISAEGETTVLFAAADAAGNAEAPQTVTIRVDKTPPSLSCSVTPNRLWPPNKKLVDVIATVKVTDGTSGAAGFQLVSVTSDEPAESSDIQGFTLGTPDTTGQLRADRAGAGPGRNYTITYSGSDIAGNTASCTGQVSVPHDQGR